MSLRLAVKRSIDDAEKDDLEVRDVRTILQLLQPLKIHELKEQLHPVRST